VGGVPGHALVTDRRGGLGRAWWHQHRDHRRGRHGQPEVSGPQVPQRGLPGRPADPDGEEGTEVESDQRVVVERGDEQHARHGDDHEQVPGLDRPAVPGHRERRTEEPDAAVDRDADHARAQESAHPPSIGATLPRVNDDLSVC